MESGNFLMNDFFLITIAQPWLTSEMAPTFVAITGSPVAMASARVKAKGSSHMEGTIATLAIFRYDGSCS